MAANTHIKDLLVVGAVPCRLIEGGVHLERGGGSVRANGLELSVRYHHHALVQHNVDRGPVEFTKQRDQA